MTLTCWTSVTDDLHNQHHFKVDSQDQCHSSVSYQMWNMISIPPSAPELWCLITVFQQNIMTSQWRWPSTFMMLNVNTSSLYPVRHLCEVLSWSVYEFLSYSGNVFWEVTVTFDLSESDQFILESKGMFVPDIKTLDITFMRWKVKNERTDRWMDGWTIWKHNASSHIRRKAMKRRTLLLMILYGQQRHIVMLTFLLLIDEMEKIFIQYTCWTLSKCCSSFRFSPSHSPLSPDSVIVSWLSCRFNQPDYATIS